MGTARIEIFRKANKHTLYPGEIDRRNPNPMEVIAVTTTEADETLSDPVSEQAGYQDLFARVILSEAGRVGIGEGSTDNGGGYQCAANQPIELPVRAGDEIAIIDLA